MWRGCPVQPSTRTLYVRVTCISRETPVIPSSQVVQGASTFSSYYWIADFCSRFLTISKYRVNWFFFFFFCKIFETIDTTPYKYSSMKVKLTFSFFSRAFLRNCNLFSSKREILYGINNAYKGNVYANPPLRILGQSTKL